MKLSVLINGIENTKNDRFVRPFNQRTHDPEINSVHYRSSEVKPGGLFVAMKGQQADGHQFIGDAISKGASAIVVSDQAEVDVNVPLVRVQSTRRALAAISSKFYGNPSESLFVVGITGTNGKTTTAYLIERILKEKKYSVGVISTINYRYLEKEHPNPLTTPESLDIQKILSEMLFAGATHIIMEVSSHGVALDRIWNCWFDIGVFTNLSQDHLDFHGNMGNYWDCKKKFFTEYLTTGPKREKVIAVINYNERGKELIPLLSKLNVVPVGSDESCMIRPLQVKFDQNGIKGTIKIGNNELLLDSRLVGRFNLENILCATGVAAAMGISLEIIAGAIKTFNHVPGRLERIPNNTERHVFVDYAHTPDALENVLSTLRDVLSGRLICVFGCGGDRDKTKRPEMGKIAARLSDLVVITSDNPRTENPDTIIEDILKGVEQQQLHQYLPKEIVKGFTKKGFVVEPDRTKAISLGVKAATKGDTILIAGKGHETYQLVGRQVLQFDDREKAAEALMVN